MNSNSDNNGDERRRRRRRRRAGGKGGWWRWRRRLHAVGGGGDDDGDDDRPLRRCRSQQFANDDYVTWLRCVALRGVARWLVRWSDGVMKLAASLWCRETVSSCVPRRNTCGDWILPLNARRCSCNNSAPHAENALRISRLRAWLP